MNREKFFSDLPKDLEEFSPLLRKLYKNVDHSKKPNLSEKESKAFEKLSKKIFKELLKDPAKVILLDNQRSTESFRAIVDLIIKINYDEDDFLNTYEYLMEEPYIADIISPKNYEYLRNLFHLRPVFISITPKSDRFYLIFKEAIECWLNDLDNACVILCWTVIEEILISELLNDAIRNLLVEKKFIYSVDDFGVKAKDKNKNLIEFFVKINILSFEGGQSAHEIRKKRNSISHRGEQINHQEAHEILNKMFSVVNDFYTNSY